MGPPSPVDWSEFHIWSPSGVYKKMKQENPAWSENNPTVTGKDLVNSLAVCAHCVEQRIQEIYRGHKPPSKTKEQCIHEPSNVHKHHILDAELVHAAYVQFAAGATGGCTATYATHWLDTVKVKMQTLPTVYQKGATYCLRETLKQEGIQGLYKGAAPAVVGQTCKTAVVFMSYGLCEEMVREMVGCSRTQDMTIWHHAAAGAMTGIVASFFLCPLELVKCRLQALNQVKVHYKASGESVAPRSHTPVSMVRQVIRSEGFHGLYRGLPGIWVKEIPGSFIYFGSYETARSFVRNISQTEHLNSRAVFLCGVFAGLCFCVTHPIESVKTRVQVMSAVSRTRGFFTAFLHIARTEGFRPMFSGLKPSMLRACLYSGIQFVVYEAFRDFFLDTD